jgi:hypothetical protein
MGSGALKTDFRVGFELVVFAVQKLCLKHKNSAILGT